MSNIITRDFAILGNTFPIRIVELNGQPWFIALDLAAALGFTIDNLKYHAKQTFAGEEKRVVKLPGFRGNGVLTISESGLYKLIMRSDKPQARLFQDWVTRDVLPAIRKMLEALGEDESKFGGIYLDAYSREKPCYLLPKDLTITLVSGYNVQMRYAITKRWMELEAQQAPKLPTSFAEALRLAAELEEQKEQERATCT